MCTVMIAEKEALINRWLELELGRMGHQVAGIASSSESAVSMAIASKPDVILMNTFLEGMYDGIEASERIRMEMDVPIIFTSSSTASDFMGRMTMAHPAGILFKPFRESDLYVALELALRNKAAEKALREKVEFMHRMLEKIPRTLFIINGSKRIIAWSALAEIFFGYSAAEMTGKNAATVTTGKSKDIFNNLIERMLKSDVPDTLLEGQKIECVKKDRASFKLEISLASWEQRGEMRVSCIAGDIPINDRAAGNVSRLSPEYRNLLKAIDVRVKKILAIIEKTARAEADFEGGTDFTSVLRECHECILTASIICDGLILTESKLKIETRSFVNTLLKEIISTQMKAEAPLALEIDIEKSEMGLFPAVIHGLIMYELVLNSIRHAFPAGRKGTLYLGLKKAEGNRHRLIVRDNGVGITGGIEAYCADTIGLRFVSVLARIMNARLEFNGEGKTEFRIVL